MPITPLHFGVLAPINHFFPNKVSNIAFIFVTLWLDAGAIMYYGFGIDRGELHGPGTHSLMGALILASLVAAGGFYSLKWVLGAYLGGITHILLDMLVHAEMQPLYPMEGNPFYMGDMGLISLILVVPFIWLIGQYVSYSRGWIARTRGEPLP